MSGELSPREVVAGGGAIVSGIIAGGGGGLYLTNQLAPPVLHPAPGIAYSTQLSTEPGLSVNDGTVGVHAPQAHILGKFPLGIHVDLTQLDLKLTGPHNTFETVAALTNNFQSEIVDPAKLALVERLAVGAGIGGFIGGICMLQVFEGLRTRSLGERLQNMKTRNKFLAFFAGLAALSGCGTNVYQNEISTDGSPVPAPLPTVVTRHNPMLKGAYITGMDRQIPSQAAKDLIDYKQTADNFWSSQATGNFTRAYDAASQTIMAHYLRDSNLVRVEQMGDVHCNYPAYPYIRQVLTKVDPEIIVEDGDMQTNSGTMPYEKDCIPDELKAIEDAAQANNTTINVIRVNAEHDAKQSLSVINPWIKLSTLRGSNNTVTVKAPGLNGWTFVGGDDPRQVILTTVPSGKVLTDQRLAQEGSSIANSACKITEETGQAPFVVSAAEQASYEALLKGCAQIAFNAHTHINGPVNVFYGQDRLREYQHTVGTATGVDEGVTMYQTPSQDSTMTTWFINKRTREPTAVFTEVLHPDGSIAITRQPTNSPPQQPSAYMEQIESYASTGGTIAPDITFNKSK